MTEIRKNLVVLFVDDEVNVTNALRRAFARRCFDVLTANSAKEALGVLSRHDVDVVVSDEQMPGVAGSEFMALVCTRYPETIRVILTGQASLEAAMNAINRGKIHQFVTKPTDAGELADRITRLVQEREEQAQQQRLRQLVSDSTERLARLEATNGSFLADPDSTEESDPAGS